MRSEPFLVRVPQITDNDAVLLVTDVLVAEGDRVEEGQTLAVVETSKAASELTAPCAGFVRGLDFERGREYSIGHPICHLTEAVDSPLPERAAPVAAPKAEPTPVSERPSAHVDATPKAQRLAQEFGIDLASLGRERVRSADLIPYLRSESERLAFLALVRHDAAFRNLGSDLKIHIYRQAGFDIGTKVVLEPGVLLVAPKIRIGDGVRIGTNTVIACDAELSIGADTQIGADGDFECVSLTIGSQVRIMEKVKMDLAGGGSGDSGIAIGDRGLVSALCYINGCRPVRLAERVALSPRSMIFTHRFWQNVFEGYDAAFAPVTMERNSWLGAAAQILPGVTVGEGAQIMSGSLVAQSIPAFALAGGIPSQIHKTGLRKALSPERRLAILDQQMARFLDHLTSKGCAVSPEGDRRVAIVGPSGKAYRLVWPAAPRDKAKGTVVIGFDLGDDGGPGLDLARQCVVGVVDRMVDEARDFFRRRGLDFTPHAWTFDRSQPL